MLVARWFLPLTLAASLSAQSSLDFDRDVRPLLAANCFACHGPDAGSRAAGLRLDRRDDALCVLPSGRRALVPGDPAASALVGRISESEPARRMPPLSSGKLLTDAQRDLLARWVAEGAIYTEPWAFRPLVRPPRPEVRSRSWVRNAIDRFILARLEANGIAPAPEAEPARLARRLALDLTGLPPDDPVTAAYRSDPNEANYFAAVDHLLASPRHAEHATRIWLDGARYGDTHGLHLDNYREIWPYRDWVLGAFARNLPFDRFATEQIAGDLLPNSNRDQQVATGFLRCHVTTAEGGSIEEEVYVRNVLDRTSTTGTVFLGLSVGCAQCHDHKFDAIRQSDFYGLFAFFNNLDGKPLDDNAKVHPPSVEVPSAEQEAGLASLRAQRSALESEIRTVSDAIVYVEPDAIPDVAVRRNEFVWIDDEYPSGAHVEGDGAEWTRHPVHSGERAIRTRDSGRHQHYFRWADQKLVVGPGDLLIAWVHLDPNDPPRELMLQFNGGGPGDGDWGHRAYFGEDLIDWGRPETNERRRIGDLPPSGRWVRLEVPVESVGLAHVGVVHGLALTQFAGTVVWDRVGVLSKREQSAQDFHWIDDAPPSGAKLMGDGDPLWQWGSTADGYRVFRGERSLRRRGRPGLHQDFFLEAPALTLIAGDRLFAHVFLDPADPPKGIQLQFHSGGWHHRVRWGAACHGEGAAEGADHRAGDLPAGGEWIRLEVALADVGLRAGDRIDGWAFTQVGGDVTWDAAGVRTWGPAAGRERVSLAAWEVLARGDATLPTDLKAALAVEVSSRSSEQSEALRAHYLANHHEPSRPLFAPLLARRDALTREEAAIRSAIPTTLVMRERREVRPAYLLERGEYDRRGPIVSRRTPDVLPPMAPEWPRDRLGFARWLTESTHPLTARVAVNRIWQRVFGTGLVRTSEDFGVQGERPSHPELLEWLAAEFVASGYDVNGLLRLIVTSATYRQSPRGTRESAVRDPENRLLSRSPRPRLDAEVLRDQALALSGLLVERVGGPSVKPPQPDGLWFAVAYRGSNTERFVADRGPEKVHRRTLYTFLKRTASPPQLATLDAPSREECRVRRERTNTPLQALLLLNDPQYVEAAKALGARTLREGGLTDRDRAKYLLELAIGRAAESADVDDLVSLVGTERMAFATDVRSARALLSVGESAIDSSFALPDLAAWTLGANLVLNLDAVLTRP